MSLCPLLRSRFSSGLQSCAPQRRISPRHWHRPRTQSNSAIYVIGHARYSNTAASGVGSVEESSAVRQNDIVKDVPPSLQTDYHNHSTFVDNNRIAGICQPDMREPGSSIPPQHDTRDSTQQAPRSRSGKPNSIGPTPQILKRGEIPTKYVDWFNRQVKPKIENIVGEDVSLRSLSLDPKVTFLYSEKTEFEQWESALNTLLWAKQHNTIPRAISEEPVFNLLDDARDLIGMVQNDCLGSFKTVWEGLEAKVKAAHWQRLALWLLQRSPLAIPEFLYITALSNHRPDCRMVVDCFQFLTTHYAEEWTYWSKGSLTHTSVIQTCLDRKNWPIAKVPQNSIRLYMACTDYSGLCKVLQWMKEGHKLSGWNILNLVRGFVKHQDAERALEAFQYITTLNDERFNMDSSGVMRHCCKILTLDSVADGPNGRNFRILPKLLEMGIRPDRDMMNLVLLNAFRTGDPQLGLDVLDFMQNRSYDFDAYTYSILLTDAVARSDRERVSTLIKEIEGLPEIRRNSHVASKLMHAYYVFVARNMDADIEPSRIFYAMLDLYVELYDITPLKELLLVPSEYTPTVKGLNEQPTLIALFLVIATYFRCQRRYQHVERIYSRFRELVLQGHKHFAPLAATDHTYNVFLTTLRDNPHGMRLCVRIVQDMLQSPPAIAVNNKSGKRIINHVKPAAQTWTILLSAFLYNKQPYAAEKVKEMMAKHNIEYNQVVWNTVINGYANAQNIPDLAMAIRTMEEQGFAVDEYTMRSLRYLHNPERLWEVMDEFDQVEAMSRGEENVREQKPPEPRVTRSPEEEAAREHEELLEQGLRRLIEKKKAKY